VTEKEEILNRRLDEMIVALKNWQHVLLDCGYPESAKLFNIAALDLQMKRHGISDAELKSFCGAIRRRARGPYRSAPPLSSLGQHFSGSQGLTAGQNVTIMRSIKQKRTKLDRG